MIFYRRWRPVKALTFDLDDTLYDNHPYIIRAEKLMYAYMHEHYPITQETDKTFWRSFRNQIIKADPRLKSDMIVLRRKTLTAGFESLGLKGQDLTDAVDNVYDCFYRERSNFRISDDIRSALAKLAEKAPLVAITNGNVDLKAVGIDEFFDTCFHASLEQPMKPHRHMFDLAKAHLSLKGSDILHVGDNLEKDVMGAKAAGFRTAWYAVNRTMNLSSESVSVLPDLEIATLEELADLI
ncbi:HAD family hydrolase [Alteromonadaceae bacterium M269]|nr:HAD family hydrolase [Alteromonadaceae bacterium M269]